MVSIRDLPCVAVALAIFSTILIQRVGWLPAESFGRVATAAIWWEMPTPHDPVSISPSDITRKAVAAVMD